MSSTKNLIHDPDDQFNATYFVEYFLSDKCLIFFGVGKFIKVISKKIFTLLVHLSVHVSSQQYNVLLKIILVW